MNPWIGKTPVEIDTALAENYYATQRAQTDRAAQADTIRHYAGESKYRHNAPKFQTLTEAMEAARAATAERSWDRSGFEQAMAGYETATETVERLMREARPMEAEYGARRWTRAFLVTSSTGHVHSTMECSTCYRDRFDPYSGQFKPGTAFYWMPEYSGKPEAEIVSDAGERACTVCYPSAPVSDLSKPTKMFTPDERSRAEKREAAAAKRVEKEAKRIEKALMPDGEPLVVSLGMSTRYRTVNGVYGPVEVEETEKITTLMAGRKWLTDAAQWTGWYAADPERAGTRHPSYPESAERVVAEAVAAKEGKAVEVVLAEAKARADKRK